jgi:hypothetical protein
MNGSDGNGMVSAVHDRSVPNEEDPLGLGALLARLGEPPAASENHESVLDLHAVADMAREVEEARFAAETRLYAQLQAAADSAAAATPQTGPEETAVEEVDVRAPDEVDLRGVIAPRPAAPLSDGEASLTDWHQELAAVVAASASELASAGNPPPTDPGAIPVDPPAAIPPPPPVRTLDTSHTDTAALLRELASLGGDDRHGGTDNSSSASLPRSGPSSRPPSSGTAAGAKNKRKGLFGR